MKCRKLIKGRKIWIDNNNSFNTRPQSVDITLYRNAEEFKTITLQSNGDGEYRFPCLIIWKDAFEKYAYTIDEPIVPNGYTKIIQGYNILNVLNQSTLTCTKTWVDNNNSQGLRPQSINITLMQNGVPYRNTVVASPPDEQDTSTFTFDDVPFAAADGTPYLYTIDEDTIEFYNKTIDGLNIKNTLSITP